MNRRTSPVRQRAIAATCCVSVVLLLGACGGDERAGCEELGAQVSGLDNVRSSNGLTVSEPAWSVVLAHSYGDFPVSNRGEIAAAVGADRAAFEDISNAVPEELVHPLTILYDAVSDSSTDADSDDQVAEARRALVDYALDPCRTVV